MPIGGVQDPQVDLDRLDAGAASLPVPASAGLGAAFEAGAHAFSDKAISFALHGPQLGMEGYDPSSDQPSTVMPITAEQANQRYGIEGALRFNQPVYDGDAAWQSAAKHRQLLDSTLLSRSNPNPLLTFGAGLAGSLTDPIGLPVMLATDGLGEFGAGALGLRGAAEAGETGAAITRLGRLANVGRAVAEPLVQGAIDNTPYVAASYGLSQATGDDYSAGDALRDIAAGAILHTGLHMAMRTAGDVLGRFKAADGDPVGSTPPTAFEPNPAPPAGVPPEVDALSPTSRQGAFALALDQMANDEPVHVGELVQQELQGMADAGDEGGARSDLSPGDLMRMEAASTIRERKEAARAASQEASDANNYQTLQRVQQVEADPRTGMLRGAADQLMAFTADKRIPRAEDLPTLLNDGTLRNGHPISDSTEAFLRPFFRDDAMTQLKPRNAVRDMLAAEAGRDVPREIQANLAERFRTGDAGDIDIVRPPGPSSGRGEAAPPAFSLERDAGEARGKEGKSGTAVGGEAKTAPLAEAAKPEASGNAGGKDEQSGAGAALKPQKAKAPRGDQTISADPELRDLLADTERLEAVNGIKNEVPEKEDPKTIADAIRAAAVCLAGEWG